MVLICGTKLSDFLPMNSNGALTREANSAPKLESYRIRMSYKKNGSFVYLFQLPLFSALLGCNGLYFDNGSGVELEPGRCRRTDGKKWRCRRDVLPHQKYCGQHIHRGAKRQMKDFQPVAVPSSSAAAMNTARLSQTAAICRKTNCAIPNTNLSISIPANPPPGRNDERSNSSSDSDTTLTDTSLTACDSSYVSS